MLWDALVEKAKSFTGCCKPEGWLACYQGVVAKYINYSIKLSAAVSNARHISSDPLMRYQNPAAFAEQQRLFNSNKSQARFALIEARVAEKECGESFDGPQPKMGGETQEIDAFLNRIKE
jgi:hypothetical protein